MNAQIYIHREGQQYGPFTKKQILDMLQNDTLSRSDIYWMEGLSDWAQVGRAFDEHLPEQMSCSLPPLHEKGLPEIVNYGGFWIRFAAYIVDMVLLYFGSRVFSKAFSELASTSPDPTLYYIFDLITAAIIAWIYFAGCDSSAYQGTIGKQLLGLKIIGRNGNRISFGRATARHFSQILSGLLLFFGYLMIGWTKKKRGLHDMIADTYVIKTKNLRTISSS
ncbi:MAG: RDD family protein [Chloroflexota bacterium]